MFILECSGQCYIYNPEAARALGTASVPTRRMLAGVSQRTVEDVLGETPQCPSFSLSDFPERASFDL